VANPRWPGPLRTNYAWYSELLDNAAWTKTNVTITPNDVANPVSLDGAVTADKVTLTAGNNTKILGVPGTSGVKTGWHCHSLYVKPGTLTRMFIELGAGPVGVVQFDLVGAGKATITSQGAIFMAGVFQLVNGWYRVWVISNLNAQDSGFGIYFGAYGAFNAAGTETMWIWGAQLSPEGQVLKYISNVTGATLATEDYSLPGPLPTPYGSDDNPVYVPYDNQLRSQPDTGQAKVRRRFTGKNEKLSFTLEVTAQQYQTFITFFETTVQEVLPFDWIDLRTNTVQTYRFMRRPSAKWVVGDSGAGFWQLSIELETVYSVNGGTVAIAASPYEYTVVSNVGTGLISGTDGTDGNPTFTLPLTPSGSYPVFAFRNGVKLTNTLDFTISGQQITFLTPNIPIGGATPDTVTVGYYA
jgi:hypothetical protein